MIIFPAIDLRQGRCVRLRQGDPDAETVFGEDPAAMARHWAGQGAEWLHVVNLDGALDATSDQLNALDRPATIKIQHPGSDRPEGPREELMRTLPINLHRLVEIREAVDIPIQFGGGLRTLDDIRLALELGADRVVLGTVAVENPGLVSEAILTWGGERIVVGIDARDGMWPPTAGSRSAISMSSILAIRCRPLGVKRVVYTDIGRDGMLSGVNVEATARLGDVTGLARDRQRRRRRHRRYRTAQGCRTFQHRRRDHRPGHLYRGPRPGRSHRAGPSSAGAAQRRHHPLSCRRERA